MIHTNPIQIISSKLWMQTKITFWKIKFVASDLFK